MKILIVGTGIVGVSHGFALSEAKLDITHLVRSNKIDTLTQNGINLDIYDMRGVDPEQRTTIYYPKVIDTCNNNTFDWIIVPTKHYQLIDTLKQIYPLQKQAKYLLFCANWDGLAEVNKILPQSQYILGYSTCSGGYDDNNTMVLNIRSSYRIGDYDNTHAKLLQEAMDLFATANFKPEIKKNMLEWLWVHHAINAGTIGALLYAGGFSSLEDQKFADIFHQATIEALQVLAKRGVDIQTYPDTNMFLQRTPAEALEHYRKLFIETEVGRRVIRAGHYKYAPEEMHQYYLDVLQTGEKLGVNIPTLQLFKQRLINS